MTTDEERIALFLDYENLAISAREDLGGAEFDLRPLSDALAERGRVVVRRAYADWSYFEEDRRMLTRHHVELIEIPQRMGAVRKNAADIKMAVDAVELSFERDYVTTFVICTGDSDFTPLVQKLRELNRRVIGVGIQASTSKLLPPACDEFLFYERLDGVELGTKKGGRRGGTRRGGRAERPAEQAPPRREAAAPDPIEDPVEIEVEETHVEEPAGEVDIARLVTQTLSGLQRSVGGAVTASNLKRAVLRKDPTFNEADYGFRAFGEMLQHLADRGAVELSSGPAKGDPEVGFPSRGQGEESDAFELLRRTVQELQRDAGAPPLSGLKNQLRRREPDFSEKAYGFSSFLQFCKAARTRGIVAMEWRDEADDYVLEVA